MLFAWLTWLLTLAIYVPTQSAPLFTNLLMLASLGLTITAIVLGAKGLLRARRTATSPTASRWGLGLGIAHLTFGFAAPALTTLAFVMSTHR